MSLPSRLALSAVSLLTEHVQSLSEIRSSQLPVVCEVLQLCWTRWSKAEEQQRLREAEEQNLYRYRAKTHLIDEGEGEDVVEGQLKGVFPDYQDFLEEGEKEGVGGEEGEGLCEAEAEQSGSVDGEVLGFSAEEMQSIAQLHMSLFGSGAGDSPKPSSTVKKASYILASDVAQLLGPIPGKSQVMKSTVRSKLKNGIV